ncbi:MAG: hypothetical protein GY760_15430 [Deltaproteobacteria bacterium]|nr:hypothetical protein [Deltaproteobacteria bacterium]
MALCNLRTDHTVTGVQANFDILRETYVRGKVPEIIVNKKFIPVSDGHIDVIDGKDSYWRDTLYENGTKIKHIGDRVK